MALLLEATGDGHRDGGGLDLERRRMRDLACGALAALECVEWEGEGVATGKGFAPARPGYMGASRRSASSIQMDGYKRKGRRSWATA